MPKPALSADAAIPLAVRGDPAARRALVERYGPLIYGLCRRLDPDPEDCYQEIWEKLLRALHRFDPDGPASFKTWAATVAHRHLVDRHRRRKVRGAALTLGGRRGEPASGQPGALEAVEVLERREALERALARLPEAQRRAVVLHHIGGLSLERIARQEGVPEGTVKSRLHRGRARLARYLSEEL